MSTLHDEIELKDFEFDEAELMFTYPCPCGDIFQITLEELIDNEDIASCPSCSLVLKVLILSEEDPSNPNTMNWGREDDMHNLFELLLFFKIYELSIANGIALGEIEFSKEALDKANLAVKLRIMTGGYDEHESIVGTIKQIVIKCINSNRPATNATPFKRFIYSFNQYVCLCTYKGSHHIPFDAWVYKSHNELMALGILSKFAYYSYRDKVNPIQLPLSFTSKNDTYTIHDDITGIIRIIYETIDPILASYIVHCVCGLISFQGTPVLPIIVRQPSSQQYCQVLGPIVSNCTRVIKNEMPFKTKFDHHLFDSIYNTTVSSCNSRIALGSVDTANIDQPIEKNAINDLRFSTNCLSVYTFALEMHSPLLLTETASTMIRFIQPSLDDVGNVLLSSNMLINNDIAGKYTASIMDLISINRKKHTPDYEHAKILYFYIFTNYSLSIVTANEIPHISDTFYYTCLMDKDYINSQAISDKTVSFQKYLEFADCHFKTHFYKIDTYYIPKLIALIRNYCSNDDRIHKKFTYSLNSMINNDQSNLDQKLLNNQLHRETFLKEKVVPYLAQVLFDFTKKKPAILIHKSLDSFKRLLQCCFALFGVHLKSCKLKNNKIVTTVRLYNFSKHDTFIFKEVCPNHSIDEALLQYFIIRTIYINSFINKYFTVSDNPSTSNGSLYKLPNNLCTSPHIDKYPDAGVCIFTTSFYRSQILKDETLYPQYLPLKTHQERANLVQLLSASDHGPSQLKIAMKLKGHGNSSTKPFRVICNPSRKLRSTISYIQLKQTIDSDSNKINNKRRTRRGKRSIKGINNSVTHGNAPIKLINNSCNVTSVTYTSQPSISASEFVKRPHLDKILSLAIKKYNT